MKNVTLINKIAIDLQYQGYDFNETVRKLQSIEYGLYMEVGQPVDLLEVENILLSM